MHWHGKLLLLMSCFMIYVTPVCVKAMDEGIVIVIEDEEKACIQGEEVRIVDEDGKLVGKFISDAKGRIALPFLSIGEYHMELEERKGYLKKEDVSFTVTAYNQKGAMELRVVFNASQAQRQKQNPSLFLLFFCLLNTCAYLLLYGLHQESSGGLLEEM